MLKAGQAALVVIGEARREEELDKVLTHAQKSIEKEIVADRQQLKSELAEVEKRLADEQGGPPSSHA